MTQFYETLFSRLMVSLYHSIALTIFLKLKTVNGKEPIVMTELSCYPIFCDF